MNTTKETFQYYGKMQDAMIKVMVVVIATWISSCLYGYVMGYDVITTISISVLPVILFGGLAWLAFKPKRD